MLHHHTFAALLWRLRRQSALYVFGAGASAPVVPMAPSLMLSTASSMVHLGSFSGEHAAETLLTARIKARADGHDFFPERPTRPGTEEFPTKEILMRLSHGGAFASFMHFLSIPRFTGRRITNYTVLNAFHPSVMLNFNLDGLASDICGSRHWIEEMHGSVHPAYGGPGGAAMMKVALEYGIDVVHDDLWPCGPETLTDRLYQKLRAITLSNPAFVMIVGYSFGKTEDGYDDALSLQAFVRRFRGQPLDVYVLDPRPHELAGILGEQLQSNRVHPFPVYWNVLAEAFARVLSGRLDVTSIDHFHEMTLDNHGPGIVFPREE